MTRTLAIQCYGDPCSQYEIGLVELTPHLIDLVQARLALAAEAYQRDGSLRSLEFWDQHLQVYGGELPVARQLAERSWALLPDASRPASESRRVDCVCMATHPPTEGQPGEVRWTFTPHHDATPCETAGVLFEHVLQQLG